MERLANMFPYANPTIFLLRQAIAQSNATGIEKQWQVLEFRNAYLHYSLWLGKPCQVILRKSPGTLNTKRVVFNSTDLKRV